MKNGDLSLVITQLVRDEKLDARVPGVLKATLKREAREKKYRSLSDYVLAILLRRGDK